MKRSGIRPKRATPRRRDTPQEKWDWWEAANVILGKRCQGRCERCDTDLHKTGVERHHRIRRRDGGDRYDNLLMLCPSCHAWVTTHPAEAYANGWSVRALGDTDPSTVPVRIRGHWFVLNNNGTKSVVP